MFCYSGDVIVLSVSLRSEIGSDAPLDKKKPCSLSLFLGLWICFSLRK
jgi:hypothetical protein